MRRFVVSTLFLLLLLGPVAAQEAPGLAVDPTVGFLAGLSGFDEGLAGETELTVLMGAASTKLTFSPRPPTMVMMVGLQGSGKTTSTGKIGRWLREQGEALGPYVAGPEGVKLFEVMMRVRIACTAANISSSLL